MQRAGDQLLDLAISAHTCEASLLLPGSMLGLRSPHSRRLWRAAWSGDEQRFRSKFDAASAEERRNLILEIDPTSGWSAPHFAAVYDRVDMLTEMLDACRRSTRARRYS